MCIVVCLGIIGTSSAWAVIIQRTAAIIVTIIITTSSSSCDVTVHVIYLVIVLSLSDLSRGGSKNDGSLGRYPSVAGYRSRTSSGASDHPPPITDYFVFLAVISLAVSHINILQDFFEGWAIRGV